MVITPLAENLTVRRDLGCEHGLSLHIKTTDHNILFDMGRGTLFLENAGKLNVDIGQVDIAVVSHGHYDHGGGLPSFLEQNTAARVFIHQKAFEGHFANRPDGKTDVIGLNADLKDHGQIVLTGDSRQIGEGLELFSAVQGREWFSQGNGALLKREGDSLTEDDFAHEQNLIVTENGKTVLFAGCAHNGIVNILKRFRELKGKDPDVVIGGFHLSNPTTKKSEDPALIQAIGAFLNERSTVYYTCHCTGPEAYHQLKEILGDRINYLATGDTIEL